MQWFDRLDFITIQDSRKKAENRIPAHELCKYFMGLVEMIVTNQFTITNHTISYFLVHSLA